MNKPIQTVPSLLTRWRKAEQPALLSIQEPLPSEPIPSPEHTTARQEWDNEGGAIKAPIVPGPKIPL